MADFQNEFSWSYSRDRMFRACLRRYWLNYYGSWGGWDSRAPEEARAIYRQKKLTSQAMWIGILVHEVAERALKSLGWAQVRGVEDSVAWIRSRGTSDVECSRTGKDSRRPSKRVEFQEHFYGADLPEGTWEEAVDEMERQVRNLFSHPVFQRMVAVKERILQVEELLQVDLMGVPVWVSLDVMMDDGRGGVVIVDWKTGKSHSDAEVGRQMGIYGLYAQQELGLAPEQIQALHVNTRDGGHKAHPVDASQLEQSRQELVESSSAMKELLSDVEGNVALVEDFPMVESGSEECRFCSFRRTCGRE